MVAGFLIERLFHILAFGKLDLTVPLDAACLIFNSMVASTDSFEISGADKTVGLVNIQSDCLMLSSVRDINGM